MLNSGKTNSGKNHGKSGHRHSGEPYKKCRLSQNRRGLRTHRHGKIIHPFCGGCSLCRGLNRDMGRLSQREAVVQKRRDKESGNREITKKWNDQHRKQAKPEVIPHPAGQVFAQTLLYDTEDSHGSPKQKAAYEKTNHEICQINLLLFLTHGKEVSEGNQFLQRSAAPPPDKRRPEQSDCRQNIFSEKNGFFARCNLFHSQEECI